MWNKWGVEVVQQNISDDDDLFFFQKDIYIKKNYTSNFLSFHFTFCISRCSLQQLLIQIYFTFGILFAR